MLERMTATKSERYRKRAEEFRKTAKGIYDDTERAKLMEIAKD